MLSRATKTSLHFLPHNLTHALRPTTNTLRPFSSFPRQPNPILYTRDTFDLLFSNDSRTDVYIRDLYKYMVTASVIGVSSALAVSSAIPAGLFSAGLALTGLGLDRLGMDFIHRTKADMQTFKIGDGSIQFGDQNSYQRKLAFVSSCLGYGCIVGSLASMLPVASSALTVSAITCMFSTLGQLTYSKFVKKENARPMEVFLSGMIGGIVGLNLISSFSTIFMLANPLSIASVQTNTYIGLLLYNALTGNKSQKAVEDVQKGKADHLKHASKFPEHWLYGLAPHFLMRFL